MLIDPKTGRVKHTDIFASHIQSQKKGIYNSIFGEYEDGVFQGRDTPYHATMDSAFRLYHTLVERRKKEGKIIFETEELAWECGDDGSIITAHKRERNDAHKLIEECMILANEEVAKWCEKRKIPFLSRTHEAPPYDKEEEIRAIIDSTDPTITPHHIQRYLNAISDPVHLYRATRLLLPKMAKAEYRNVRAPHFGLALDYYSHFTSPIRRYPDLITHRMIHAYLARNTGAYYSAKKLGKIAADTSEKERRAEGIESLVHTIYSARYMTRFIDHTMSGRVSHVSEWAIFVMLDNGIEVTVLLPWGRYSVDTTQGILYQKNKKLSQIGESISVIIDSIHSTEYRIFARFSNSKTGA